MAFTVRRIDYFYTTVKDSPGAGYEVLSRLAELNVNLVAITAVPFGPARTQLTVFPDDTAKMKHVAEQANIPLDGPHPALVVQGCDLLKRPAGFCDPHQTEPWQLGRLHGLPRPARARSKTG